MNLKRTLEVYRLVRFTQSKFMKYSEIVIHTLAQELAGPQFCLHLRARVQDLRPNFRDSCRDLYNQGPGRPLP